MWRSSLRGRMLTALAVVTLLTAPGCVVGYGAGAHRVRFVEAPRLALVHPGLWAVVDYPTPVFYYSGYYWMYDNDGWYRAPSYDRPWVRVSLHSMPGVLLRLQTHRFRYYQPASHVYVTRAGRYGPVLRSPARFHGQRSTARRVGPPAADVKRRVAPGPKAAPRAEPARRPAPRRIAPAKVDEPRPQQRSGKDRDVREANPRRARPRR